MNAMRVAVRHSSVHRVGILFAALIVATPLGAQQAPRRTGPVIHSAGGVFEVTRVDFETPLDLTYRVAFDVSQAAESPTEVNPGLNTVARFLNMHGQAGVPLRQLQVAVVLHGTAGKDLLRNEVYRSRLGVDNPNAVLLQELVAAGVRLILCGQTAASRGLPTDGFFEPVELALSAMTALVVLQEEGYHVNPF
jgi:intracellular sulfur oxidation DsrE/DsrF family protein